MRATNMCPDTLRSLAHDEDEVVKQYDAWLAEHFARAHTSTITRVKARRKEALDRRRRYRNLATRARTAQDKMIEDMNSPGWRR